MRIIVSSDKTDEIYFVKWLFLICSMSLLQANRGKSGRDFSAARNFL